MTETMLHVSDEFALPLALVTESNGVLAKKGAGKTNALIVLLEEMYAAGAPVVSIDPKGDHYGIRSSADGKKDGLPIPVFGGRHGDIPLEPSAGALIADLVRDRNLSVVLDVSEFTKADRRRFLTAFAERIYKHPSRTPMHLFLEECHEYIPQNVSGENAAMVGAFELLVKGGRFKGLGVTLVSQRSASVNKNVLTQVDNLFVLRTLSAQDRAAVKGWISDNADGAEILAQLPHLQNGEAWLWQPERGEPVKFRFRMRHTFDAGATPKMGEVAVTPATLADVDLDQISAAMAATIEKAKAEDPKELRRALAAAQDTIVKLEAKLEWWENNPPEKVSALTEEDHRRLSQQTTLIHQGILDLLRTFDKDIAANVRSLVESADKIAGLMPGTDKIAELKPGTVVIGARPPALVSQFPKREVTEGSTSLVVPFKGPRPVSAPSTDGLALQKAHRAILTVLAQRGTQTVQQVSVLAGYTATGGGFRNALGALRSAGYLELTKDPLTATEAGLAALGEFEPLPTGRALVDYWLTRLGKAERLILETLVNVWPAGMSQEDVASVTNYEANGGGFRNSIGRLRTLTLIRGDRHALFADDALGEASQQ